MATPSRAPAAAGKLPNETQSSLSGPELLQQRVVLTLFEMCTVLNLDRSTVLRWERDGVIPPRRAIGTMGLWLTADLKAWMEGASAGRPDPARSERSKKIAQRTIQSRGAKTTEVRS